MKTMSKAELYQSKILDEILDLITPEETEKTRKRMMLAARIDDGMIAKGWKNSDLAKALDKQPSVISKWLSGTHNFNIETLFDIEAVLGVILVTIEQAPKTQVIHYHVSVSGNVVNDPNPDYTNSLSLYSSPGRYTVHQV
jgi:ribosome-binding protein aMBF1 (putative translation factor)